MRSGRWVPILALAVSGVFPLVGTFRQRDAEAVAVTPLAGPALLTADYHGQVVPLLQKYCYGCHAAEEKSGGLSLDAYKTPADVSADPKRWDKLMLYVRNHQMPPADADAPTQAERDRLIEWTSRQLYHYDPATPDPGRVTIRRLNRTEYDNTVRDLTGMDLNPSKQFPSDDLGYGFDNNGDVLSLPPMLMEKYIAAADSILDHAIVTDPIAARTTRTPGALGEFNFYSFGDRGDGWVHLDSLEQDFLRVEEDVPMTAVYKLRVRAFAQPTGGLSVTAARTTPVTDMSTVATGDMVLSFTMDDTVVKDVVVKATENDPQVYEATFTAPAGKHKFGTVVQRVRGPVADQRRTLEWPGKEQPGVVFVRYLEVEGPLAGAARRYAPAEMKIAGHATTGVDGVMLPRTGDEASVAFDLPAAADVVLGVEASQNYAGPDPARMELRVDGKAVGAFDVKTPARLVKVPGEPNFNAERSRPVPRMYEVHARLAAGKHRASAVFLNDLIDPANPNPNRRDRNLVIGHIEVIDRSRPLGRPALPETFAALFSRHGVQDESAATLDSAARPAAARAILAEFGRRAWRRPLASAELDRLMTLYDAVVGQKDTFYAAVKLPLKAVLCSPHFIYRGETRPLDESAAPTVQPVDEFALASRLSYFLWSTTPDEELLGLAERGQLRQNLRAQVRRMLAAPQAQALVTNFAGQWLQFRQLESHHPDNKQFATYNTGIREAMAKETELLFTTIMREDRSVMEFLTADYTFVNRELAAYYGMKPVDGDEFRRVSLQGTNRRGVITQGSVLTLTSNPTRTSPVKRGRWVLEQLLGGGPPPPPPDIPSLVEEGAQVTGTLRHQMEKHRDNPNCISCHSIMDPIGFGLENFDAVGAWRDKDGGQKIDASGTLISGEEFAGGVQLADTLVKTRREDFLRCLSEKMMTYALGRGVEPFDRPAVNEVMRRLDSDGTRFSALVEGVVESVPFQFRRGDAPGSAAPVGEASVGAASGSEANASN